MAQRPHGAVSVQNEANVNANAAVEKQPPWNWRLGRRNRSGIPDSIDGGDLKQ